MAFLYLLFIGALASRVLAFNITVNSQNLTTTEILNVPNSTVVASCATDCTNFSSQLKACNDDAVCLCKADTVAALLNCEQCMFTALIALNQQMDSRVGSQAVLSGYATTCKAVANITLAASQITLNLPDSWDGPFVAVFPVGSAIIVVIIGAVLGFSALFLLSSL